MDVKWTETHPFGDRARSQFSWRVPRCFARGPDALFVRIKDNLLVSNRSQLDAAGLIFMVASGLMVAHQVAGKAVRDGLFLSRFAPSDLPKVVAAAALAAVLLGLG